MKLPAEYLNKLSLLETEQAIKQTKDLFENHLATQLQLTRVSAPKFLVTDTGLQDDLAGTQVPVSFHPKTSPKPIEVVHSLAKWKRHALNKYSIPQGKGIYTDMDAIRKDESLSDIHSLYVDQWDWEKHISKEQRTLETLLDTVKTIYQVLKTTERQLHAAFPCLHPRLPESIHFIHAQELELKFPSLTPRQRETLICKEFGAVFLIGIGHSLSSGNPHDLRAFDYDDWSTQTELGYGLNGDILVWDDIRQESLELSSMGIRVDATALKLQAEKMEIPSHQLKEFHSKIVEEKLPYSIGGGIGQSRICMFLLHKAHIGEVQVSFWPMEMHKMCQQAGIFLL